MPAATAWKHSASEQSDMTSGSERPRGMRLRAETLRREEEEKEEEKEKEKEEENEKETGRDKDGTGRNGT